MSVLGSRDNPRVRRWAKLARDSRLRRSEGRAIVEGPHLLAAGLAHAKALFGTEKGLARPESAELVRRSGLRPVTLSESLFRGIVDAESPPGIAAEIAIPRAAEEQASSQAVFLESVQDPANVGAILRSAAAFGAGAVVLDRACADPWSPKALRAGMGGHFALCIREVRALEEELEGFQGRLVCTVPRGGVALGAADLSGRVGWLFGAEGRGVSPAAARHAALRVTIPMARGAESLNVAAAAAICLYAAFSTPGGRS